MSQRNGPWNSHINQISDREKSKQDDDRRRRRHHDDDVSTDDGSGGADDVYVKTKQTRSQRQQ